MARDGVVLQRVHAHVLAAAARLHAAVRHLVDEHEAGVDPGAAVLQLLGDAHRAADVLGPDRRREAVVAVVRPGDRLFGVGEARHADDRTEDLALDDLVVLARARDHGRLVEEARARTYLA